MLEYFSHLSKKLKTTNIFFFFVKSGEVTKHSDNFHILWIQTYICIFPENMKNCQKLATELSKWSAYKCDAQTLSKRGNSPGGIHFMQQPVLS